MSLEEYKGDLSGILKKIFMMRSAMETCVNKRNTIGAPGPEAMKKVIALHEAYLGRVLIVIRKMSIAGHSTGNSNMSVNK